MVKVITEYEAFVYIWFDLLKKMYYIGYHKGSEYDNYAHSSTRMESFNMDNVPPQFKRRILFRGTVEECRRLEIELLQNRKSSGKWGRYYNLAIAGYMTFDETVRAKMSESSKKLWEDPLYRANQIEIAKKRWQNPVRLAKMSENNKKVWRDPERRAKQSEITKKQWEDPEYREVMKKVYQDPVRCAKLSESTKKQWEDPEYRAMKSESSKKLWQDPEYRAKHSKSMKKVYQDPEYRAKMTESSKKLWQDPVSVYRAKMPCEHCGKMVNKLNMARWHGDNCKHKKVKSYG